MKMKRWKATLEEYNYKCVYKPGKENVVADALSRPPRETETNNVTTTGGTQHSDSSSGENLIQTAEEPVNVYKNQIILIEGENPAYEIKIIFPTYHRHIIKEQEFTKENLIKNLKKYLDPRLTNAIHCSEKTLNIIQQIYPENFSRIKSRYTRKIVEDITNENEQVEEIIKEHNRAHRNGLENKLQIIRKMYFPKMRAKIERIVRNCSICKEQKYDRHPNKPQLKETPIPQFPGHIVHLDLYFTNKNTLLTAIDKFSKYAIVKILKSRAVEDIKTPLREIITSLGIPNIIVCDNEKSFTSREINFMIENQYGIKVHKAPPYSSSSNGQIERFHSTYAEIIRCVQTNKTHSSFSELIDSATFAYNHTIHSTTGKTPIEIFFGRPITSNLPFDEKLKKEIVEKLKRKQEKDMKYHNKKREEAKNYKIGDQIYVKVNTRIGNKLTAQYKKETVAENLNSTIVTTSGKVVHKSIIKNEKQ